MKQTSETMFEPDWLALREPADQAARNPEVLEQAARLVPAAATVLDLGSGTGSTARAFAKAGHTHLIWRFFDNDPTLLNIAKTRHPDATCIVGDLAQVDDLPLNDVSLITASALFDLMPEHWVKALMTRARELNLPVYAAINYDGVMQWTPADRRDNAVTDAFNHHQFSDKGLGPALGPTAGQTCTRLAATCGFDLQMAPSSWKLGPEDAPLHGALIKGIAEAADETGLSIATDWGRDRCSLLSQSHGVVGHTDLLMVPK